MKTIAITRTEIENFRSFLSTTVTFSNIPGLKQITGNNEKEPRLGANGCGKTSLLEAIVWCLYGSGIRGAKTSSVLSWGREKVAVKIYLNIDDTEYCIHRYGPPTKLELNGTLVEQSEIDKLIGLSKQRFLNSVIFGQATLLFPDLSTPERSELLDSVLNLGIWQQCTERATEKTKLLEQEINAKAVEISFIEGKLAGLPSEEELLNSCSFYARRITEWNIETADTLKELELKRDSWENEQLKFLEAKAEQKELLVKELSDLREKEAPEPKSSNESQLTEEIAVLENIVQEASNIIAITAQAKSEATKAKVFWKQSICPACEQTISAQKKDKQLSALLTKIEEADKDSKAASRTATETKKKLERSKEKLKVLRDAASKEAALRRTVMRDIARLESQIAILKEDANRILTNIENKLDPYSKQITHLKESKNPYVQQEIDAQKKLKAAKIDREKLTEEKSKVDKIVEKIKADLVATEYWKHGFKHIRLYFVEQILSVLQIEIQSAVGALGLDGWTVKLQTETETKSGTTKLGINIIISSPVAEGSWENWSGGETQRLRLAIAIGLASLIQRAAGVFFTVEFYDEQSKALSQQGIEDFLEVLRTRAEILKKQIFIVDHSNIQFAGFDETWTVTKTYSGSQLYKR